METICLNCFVLGDDPDQILQVEIAPTASVGDLKKVIKEEKRHTLDGVDAERLKLWKVDLPVDGPFDRDMRRDIKERLPLSPVAKLFKLFSKLPEEEHLHIAILNPAAVPMFILNCLVLGDDPNHHTFPVKIARTETVSVLKDLIKEKKRHAFDGIDADRLKLWNVDTFDPNMLRGIEHRPSLSAGAELQDSFPDPQRDQLHIVILTPDVLPPPPPIVPMFNLNCLVLGDDPKYHTFPVKIAQTETVSVLKKVIKEEKRHAFDGIDADRLKLWNVDLPTDDAFDPTMLRGIEHKVPLSAVAELQDSLPDPQRKRLHIVIQSPVAGSSLRRLRLLPSERGAQQFREKYANEFPSEAPSSQAIPSKFNNTVQKKENHKIYWERPRAAAHVIPTTLLHPIFGQFIDDSENHEPTAEDNSLVLTLSEAMCGFFDDEKLRGSKFREILREHHIDLIPSTIEYSNYKTDGDMQYGGFRYAILEVKNELGSTQAEPHMQSILYYVQSTKSLVRKQPESRFPCILITLFGPHIDFLGVVMTTRPNVQMLSTTLPLFYHDSDTRMRTIVARHVGAFRKALRSLKEYCEEIDSRSSSPTPSMDLVEFPFRCSYTCIETSSTRHFRYICQIDKTKLIFAAQMTQTTDEKTIFVKFVRRYSKDVHKLCASQDLAPALYGFDYLPGGWYMVVMELIEDYRCLRGCDNFSAYEDEIAQKLEYLHQSGLVHGDIRDTNIMVKKHGSGIKLVDFDWSGKIGEIRYPMNVYRGVRLWRPDGAKDGQLIMAEHDIEMLRAIFHGPPSGF